MFKKRIINKNQIINKEFFFEQEFYSKQKIKNVPYLRSKKIKSRINPQNNVEKNLFLKKNMKEIQINKFFFKENIKVMGILWKKVILCFDKKTKSLLIFDQHAIHERIRYEFFIRKMLNLKNPFDNNTIFMNNNNCSVNLFLQIIKSTILLKITLIKLKNNNLKLIENIKEKLNFYGWEYSIDKNNEKISIKKIPKILEEEIGFENFEEFVEDIIISNNENMIPEIVDKILMYKSCRNAIKFNDLINKEQAEKLIFNLSYCNFPFFCVHGRNSIFPLRTFFY